MDVPKERMDSEIHKYLELRLNDLKLKTVDGLSVGVSRVLALMVVLMLAAIVLAAFAFGTVFFLGGLIGSWSAAAFIVGGIFLFVLIAALLLWKRLFTDLFVKIFIGIFYGNE
ncbi:MAG: hypothetical protein IKU36_03130 [Bacteroidales bacterium]|nr:hypothetical protein [Bacteroidales bacterium]